MEKDLNNILILSTDLYDYKNFIRISYELNHAQITDNDEFWLERIDTPVGTPTAVHLLTSQQPVYFWQSFPEDETLIQQNIMDTVFISEHTYLQSYEYEDEEGEPEKKYNQEWINVSDQIKGASTSLYDLDIADLGERVYGYRLHYFTYDDTIEKNVISHLATQFSALSKFSLPSTELEVLYGTHRPCITDRNFAYRGKNSIEKYNYTFIEINADDIILNNRIDSINTGTITLSTNEIIDIFTPINNELNKLYSLIDKVRNLRSQGVDDGQSDIIT